jgi:Flp pilus assembly protein TadG
MRTRFAKRTIERRKRERGTVLVIMAVAAVVLIGFLGLSVDLGSMYITKNEAQAYADSGAIAAALRLDGTAAGVTAAQTAAEGMNNKWAFATKSFSGTVVEVSTSAAGPWTPAGSPPNSATDYSYARVTANASVPLYLLPLFQSFNGGPLTQNGSIRAVAVAGQLPQTTFNTGAFPFSPIAFDGPNGGNQTTAPWGFVAGNQYTMRYAANGKSACAGDDADSDHVKNGSARGFWGAKSAATASSEIEGLTQEESLTVGQALPGVGGAKTSVESAIVARIDQDGDTTDDTYAAYLANAAHNGQRIVTMPIQSEVNGTVLGFLPFLLLDDSSYGHTGNANWCAVYIGATVSNSTYPGASSSGGPYQVKLVQ